MTTQTILVTGAAGTIGRDLVPQLVANGADVRAMTRDPQRHFDGAQTTVADLADAESVRAALAGVNAVFLNSPSSEEAADLQIRFAEIAREAGVDRLVLLSQYGADAASPVRFLRWHAQVESRVRELGLAGAILRPNLYLQTLLGFADTISAGMLAAPAGSAAVSAIDTRDVAAVAAHALLSAAHDERTYTLTGPRAVTHSEIAQALTDATATSIAYHDVPASAFAGALQDFMPPWLLDGLVEDYDHYARGEAAGVTSDVTDVTGRPARDLVDFARDYAPAFTRP